MAKSIETCGCCEGIAAQTPELVTNRPGLRALTYRVGTHSSFLESMLARLSNHDLPVDAAGSDKAGASSQPLRDLGTRDRDDPSIALLDGWATVADVLTFYQERIANEGFLRTAEKRRSVLELARLVGYRLRPGVAASTWLALELDKGYRLELKPHEVKAQSVPEPEETAQTFENIEPIEARQGWNQLKPRLTQPQTLSSVLEGLDLTPPRPRLDIQGVSTDVKREDAILITAGGAPQGLFHVAEVEKDAAANRTRLIFREEAALPLGAGYWVDADVIRALDAAVADFVSWSAQQTSLGEGDANTVELASSRLEKMRREALAVHEDAEIAEEAMTAHLRWFEVQLASREFANSETLRAGLGPLTRDLEAAIDSVRLDAAREKAVAFAKAINPDVGIGQPDPTADPLRSVMQGLTKAPSLAPRNSQSIDRDLARVFAKDADTGLRLTGALSPELGDALPTALAGVRATPDSTIRAYIFRASARPFGHNAAARPVVLYGFEDSEERDRRYRTYTTYVEWKLNDPLGAEQPNPPGSEIVVNTVTSAADDTCRRGVSPPLHHDSTTLYLDADYKVADTGWAVVENPGSGSAVQRQFLDLACDVYGVDQVSLNAYGISGKSTRIQLKDDWLSADATTELMAVRQISILCESEELTLAEEPIVESIGARAGTDWIELDGLYSGLESGRWVVVTGDRDDVLDATGTPVKKVATSELAMLAEVVHGVKDLPPGSRDASGYGPGVLPGDSTHSFIRFDEPLAYSYDRATVTIYGNVVKATHGETRTESMGAGDAAKTFQSFELKQTPLTYVASPTPAGAESTLDVRVNDVRWHEAEYLNDLGSADRGFVTKTGDEGKTSVVFGDGITGARLPTGLENVSAVYRSGIGKVGNVKAKQISQLAARPLGLKGLVNPLRASGGADREDRDTARENVPHTVTALDRLVSVSDYADFARTFAGIGKAQSTTISDGRREWVHVTVAGADDIPIDTSSDLYRNLLQALHDFGEPSRAVALQVREALLLVIGARVRILADYLWDKVADAIRATMLDTFGFARRALGQDTVASEVIAAIQAVEGVAWVDLDTLGGLPERKTETGADGEPVRRLLTPQELSEAAAEFLAAGAARARPQPRIQVHLAGFEGGAMRPAQVAYLTPEVSDTLVLNQVSDPTKMQR